MFCPMAVPVNSEISPLTVRQWESSVPGGGNLSQQKNLQCQTAVKVSLWPIVLNYCFTASQSSTALTDPQSCLLALERGESTAVSEKRTKYSQNCLHFVPRLAVKVSAGCWSLAVLVLSLGVPVLGLGATVSISSLYLTVSPHSAASRGIPGVPGGETQPAVQSVSVFLYKYWITFPPSQALARGWTQVHWRTCPAAKQSEFLLCQPSAVWPGGAASQPRTETSNEREINNNLISSPPVSRDLPRPCPTRTGLSQSKVRGIGMHWPARKSHNAYIK